LSPSTSSLFLHQESTPGLPILENKFDKYRTYDKRPSAYRKGGSVAHDESYISARDWPSLFLICSPRLLPVRFLVTYKNVSLNFVQCVAEP